MGYFVVYLCKNEYLCSAKTVAIATKFAPQLKL